MVLKTVPCIASATQSVTLGWDPSPDPTVAGYRVHYGTTSGDYGSQLAVTSGTQATISGLQQGTTYFFAVTAVDNFGLESLPSNEVSFDVPACLLALKKIQLNGFPSAFQVTSTGPTPRQWILEATSDWRTWRTVAKGSNQPVSVSIVTDGAPSLFFRLISQ